MTKPRVFRPAAYVILEDGGRILLCRLSRHGPERLQGHWTLPGGGLDFGEHPLDAAIREAREETGLEVQLTGELHVDSEVYEDADGSVQHLRFIYKGVVAGGNLCHEVNGSTDRCEWVSPSDAESMELVGIARLGIKLLFGFGG